MALRVVKSSYSSDPFGCEPHALVQLPISSSCASSSQALQ